MMKGIQFLNIGLRYLIKERGVGAVRPSHRTQRMVDAAQFPLTVYPMDPSELTEEQIAVIFAMTSRRPEPFSEIRQLVTEEKAADFHERWVLNYGHASVAEHAMIHMAVENVSRLACDTLEDNRLASYTEKSSRYQVFSSGYFLIPSELDGKQESAHIFRDCCTQLFDLYEQSVDDLQTRLKPLRPQRENESDGGYRLRIRREATDSARSLLPAATLTNVGVTMNARSMEHAIRKLLSAELFEEQALGELLKVQGRRITPTLIKYADRNQYLVNTRANQYQVSEGMQTPSPSSKSAALVHVDQDAEDKIVTAFLYKFSNLPYEEVLNYVKTLTVAERDQIIDATLSNLGSHDAPVRELESAYCTFEFTLDYGAYREFKRHRMQTYIPQRATTTLGFVTPSLFEETGLTTLFQTAMDISNQGYAQLLEPFPEVAQYLVTHAHKRRVISTLNLRECFHLFKLRTQPTAHFSLVEVMNEAVEQLREVHPSIFKHLKLRT